MAKKKAAEEISIYSKMNAELVERLDRLAEEKKWSRSRAMEQVTESYLGLLDRVESVATAKGLPRDTTLLLMLEKALEAAEKGR